MYTQPEPSLSIYLVICLQPQGDTSVRQEHRRTSLTGGVITGGMMTLTETRMTKTRKTVRGELTVNDAFFLAGVSPLILCLKVSSSDLVACSVVACWFERKMFHGKSLWKLLD